MRRIFIFLLLLFPGCLVVSSQNFTDSNLPIIIINTDGGVSIKDSPRVNASMRIIYRGKGKRNYTGDADSVRYLDYTGRIGIEIRGSSSQSVPKKQYGFSTLHDDGKTNRNVPLLGMPADNDWILNGLAYEPSLIRDFLNYNLSRLMGQYASRTVYCELVLNGSYKGLYVLQEKIKQGKGRVDISKITPDDNLFPDVTGGYITKSDKTTGGDPVAWKMSTYYGSNDVDFIHHQPEGLETTEAQNAYIKGEFARLLSTSYSGNASIKDGFPSVIDVPSFVDFMLLNEYAANADAYQFSTYYHKDRNGKLRAGPVWDMNLTYGYDLTHWGLDRSKYDTWQFANGDNTGPRYWKDLFDNQLFKCYLSRRFNQLIQPGMPLNKEFVYNYIDSIAVLIDEAAQREQQRWGTVPSLGAELSKIRDFIDRRIPWMTSRLGSFQACSDVQSPPLVISKIMYAPATGPGFPDSDSQEFIELTNAGSAEVNLTGFYFSGTGFVYCFPENSKLKGGESLFLAGDAAVFRARYRMNPFGQFTRNLAAEGENLVLADAFGNVIDNVSYSWKEPWPEAASNGKYIKLTDLNADNNSGLNWIASEDKIVSSGEILSGMGVSVYPSPFTDKLVIKSNYGSLHAELITMGGAVIKTIDTEEELCIINTTDLKRGIYILRLLQNGEVLLRKVVKI